MDDKQDMPQPRESSKERIFTRAFILMALVNLLTFTSWQMILTGLPLYLDLLGANPVSIGLTTTLATGAAVIVRPISGVAVDRYGRRGVLVMGFIVMALAVAFYAIIPVAGTVLVLRFIHGLGWGFGSTANSTIAADIIPRRRFAEGMGYYAMTNSLSMALAPAFAIWLMDNGYSQGMIYTAAGFTVASLVMAIVLFVTDYEQPPLKNQIPLSEAFALKNMFEKSAVFPSCIAFLVSMGLAAISTFLALMAAERGIDGVELYFIAYAIVNVVTRPLVGKWADTKGFYYPGIIACLTYAASLVVIAYAQTLTVILIAGVLVGFGMGTATSVFQTMAVATVPPSSRGAATSTNLFLFNGGIAFGSFLAGLVLKPLGYSGMFLLMALFSVLGCIVFVSGGRARIDRYHEMQHQ